MAFKKRPVQLMLAEVKILGRENMGDVAVTVTFHRSCQQEKCRK